MITINHIVVRTALIDARKYVRRGLSADEAARLACIGAWLPYREAVAERLRAEMTAALTHPVDEQAA